MGKRTMDIAATAAIVEARLDIRDGGRERWFHNMVRRIRATLNKLMYA
jgi:hypothetical protein